MNPTDGLDPNQKHDVRRIIRDMARDKTIILSTHILEEVEQLCERVIIIATGEIVADATPRQLKTQSTRFNAVNVAFNADIDITAVSARVNSTRRHCTDGRTDYRQFTGLSTR